MQCPLKAISNGLERARCAESNCAWWYDEGCVVIALPDTIRDLNSLTKIATAIINTGKKIEASLDDIHAVI